MSWAAVAGGVASAVAGQGMQTLGGSAKARRNEIAPGLSKYTAARESGIATDRHNAALAQYMQQMQGLTGQAQGAGNDIMGMFNSRAGALQGMAGRATGEVSNVYKNFGREQEGVSRQNYADLLANIQDQQAISRARQGGVNSGQDMLAAGQQALATRGLNANLADIAGQRAQLYGGALERGRAQEMQLGTSLLGQGMAARERQFTLPAQYQSAAIGNQFNAQVSPTALYDQRNLQLALGGGSRSNLAQNPMGQLGGSLMGVGGYMFGNALDRYMNQPSKTPTTGGGGGGGVSPWFS
jgi:hypothetical protein